MYWLLVNVKFAQLKLPFPYWKDSHLTSRQLTRVSSSFPAFTASYTCSRISKYTSTFRILIFLMSVAFAVVCQFAGAQIQQFWQYKSAICTGMVLIGGSQPKRKYFTSQAEVGLLRVIFLFPVKLSKRNVHSFVNKGVMQQCYVLSILVQRKDPGFATLHWHPITTSD